MSLTARLLEEHGISCVILGSARDIVEYCGVARFLFTDFPLGNPCGVPYDTQQQHQILSLALELFSTATHPGQTQLAPFKWPGDAAWRTNYSRVGPDNAQQLKEMGERRRKQQMAEKSEVG